MHPIVPLIASGRIYRSVYLKEAVMLLSLQYIEEEKKPVPKQDVLEGLILFYKNRGAVLTPDVGTPLNILTKYACEGMSVKEGVYVLKRIRDEHVHILVFSSLLGKVVYRSIIDAAKTFDDFYLIFLSILYASKSNPVRKKNHLVAMAKQKLSQSDYEKFSVLVLQPAP